MTLTIRRASASDIPSLRQLGYELQENERLLCPDRAPAAEIVDQYNAITQRVVASGEWVIFVALDGDQFVGYTAGAMNDPEDDLINLAPGFHVDDIVVAKSHRGQGIGRQLLDAIGEYAKEQGAKSIELNVLSANVEAQAFYRKVGFQDYELVLKKKL